MDSLAAWTGVIGAAVGASAGLLGSWIQAKSTRSEGDARRAHDRDMRLLERRSAAYVTILDFMGRTAGWTEAIERAAREPGGSSSVPQGLIAWNEEAWYSMMAPLRAFGTPSVLSGFVRFHEASRMLNSLLLAHSSGALDRTDPVLSACANVRSIAGDVQRTMMSELQPNVAPAGASEVSQG